MKLPTPDQIDKAANEPIRMGTPIFREAQDLHACFQASGYKHRINPPVFEAGVHVGLRLAEMIRAEARADRLAYLEQHADAIVVRVRVGQETKNVSLAECAVWAPEVYEETIARLLERDQPPHRKLKPGEVPEPIEW